MEAKSALYVTFLMPNAGFSFMMQA